MKCPVCNFEMRKGYVKAREAFDLLNFKTEVIWYPSEDSGKIIKKNYIPLEIKGEGYFCDRCNKAVAIFEKI